MQDLHATAIRVIQGRLSILDQTLLPHEERWLECEAVDELITHIQDLKVRGAPMIAIAASLLAARRAEIGDDKHVIAEDLQKLRESRPTAVNLMHAMDRLAKALQNPQWQEKIVAEAVAVFEEDRALCDAIAKNGAALFAANDRILTHCNTGSLATAGVGTAMGVIRRAHEEGKNISVWVDETRPLLQGGRLTAWECGKLGIPYHLITDSMAASLMAAGKVDKVIVGADRIAANGDVANKIGTYSLAVLAKHHEIPFYVAAPHTTVDPNCANAKAIPIEQRAADEVRGAMGKTLWAPAQAPVYNPAFDLTPATLVSAWVLDSGVYRQSDVEAGIFSS